MHLALVIGSTYDDRDGVEPLIHSKANSDLFADALSRLDSGFRVEALRADRDLLQVVEQRLAAAPEPIESVLLYFVGYAAHQSDRGLALILDGERLRALPVSRLSQLLVYAVPESCAIFDLVLYDGHGTTPAEAAEELARGAPRAPCSATLGAVQTLGSAPLFGPSRFTDLALVGLRYLSENALDPGRVTATALFDSMQAEVASFSQAGATAFVAGSEDFVLLRNHRKHSGVWGASTARTSWAPPSVVAPVASEPPLPRFDDAVSALPPLRAPSFETPSSVPPATRADAQAGGFLSLPPRAHQMSSPPSTIPSPPPTMPSPAPRLGESVPREGRAPLESVRAAALETVGEVTSRLFGARKEPRTDRESLARELLSDAESVRQGLVLLEQLADDRKDQPVERARLLVEAARAAVEQLDDRARATSLALAALDADPESWAAFEIAELGLKTNAEFSRLVELYERQLARTEDRRRAAGIAERLVDVYRETLGDEDKTRDALARLIAVDPRHPRAHALLGRASTHAGDIQAAIEHYRIAIAGAPAERSYYAKIFALFERTDSVEDAFQAANALSVLGSATPAMQALSREFRVETLGELEGELTDREWLGAAFGPEPDRELARLFSAVMHAAVAARFRTQRKNGSTSGLENAEVYNAQEGTEPLARSLLWTEKLLRVPSPRLYLREDAEAALTPIATETPTTVARRSLGREVSLRGLAFLWGRHLSLFRPEQKIARFFSNPLDIHTLLRASFAIADDDVRGSRGLDRNARHLAQALESELEEAALRELRAAAADLRSADLLERGRKWLMDAERTRNRAGLLAAGDLTVAADTLRRFPDGALLSTEEAIQDLCAFAVSAAHAQLRCLIGANLLPRQKSAAS